MSDLKTLEKLAEKRRSVYALSDQLPVSNDEIVKLVEHAVLHTPSSFNSQSTRIAVLFGDDHNKLWQLTEDTLHDIVDNEEQFAATKQKMDGFKAGAGTILFLKIIASSETCKLLHLCMQTNFQFGRTKPMRCTSTLFGRR